MGYDSLLAAGMAYKYFREKEATCFEQIKRGLSRKYALLERDELFQRKIRYHMPVLSKDLSYPLKHSFLFRVLWYMAQKYCSLRKIVEQVL
jgi:hypothetical protein